MCSGGCWQGFMNEYECSLLIHWMSFIPFMQHLLQGEVKVVFKETTLFLFPYKDAVVGLDSHDLLSRQKKRRRRSSNNIKPTQLYVEFLRMFWYSQSYDPGSQPAASVTAVNPNRQKAANFQLHQIKESSMWKCSFLFCFSFLVDFFLKPTHLHSCSYYRCYNHVRFASFHRSLLHPCVVLPPLQRDGLGWQESDGRLYVGQFSTNHIFT